MKQVSLAKSHRPRYPDCCAVCSVAAPGDSIRLDAYATKWSLFRWAAMGAFLPGPRSSVEVPVCGHCRRRIRRRIWLGRFVLAANGAIALAVTYWLFGWHEGFAKKRLWILGVLLLTMPAIMFELWFPLPLSLSVESGALEYSFENEEFADEFEALNAIPDDFDTIPNDFDDSAGDLEEPPQIIP